MSKLNIGCGNDIREGWVNLDMVKSEGVDIIHDVNKYPLPFEDNTFDEINAEFIFEHLYNPKEFIDEVYRICKNDAKVHIETEHFSSCSSWGDITHVRPFSFCSLYHVEVGRKQHNLLIKNDVNFEVNSYMHVNPLIDWLINAHIKTKFIYEKTFIKWILPCRYLEFNLVAIKKMWKRTQNYDER